MSSRLLTLLVPAAVVAVLSTLLLVAPGATDRQVFAIPSGNMERTLPVGKYVSVAPGDVRRGSIVVHRSALLGPRKQTLIRRVIAVGGDRIACCGPTGKVVLNGRELNEPYVFEDDKQPFCAAGAGASVCGEGAAGVLVPDGRLWLMGDHRARSNDSRSFIDDAFAGTVAAADVVGLVDGPYSRLRAHLQPVIDFAPHLLAIALIAGLAVECILRLRRRSKTG